MMSSKQKIVEAWGIDLKQRDMKQKNVRAFNKRNAYLPQNWWWLSLQHKILHLGAVAKYTLLVLTAYIVHLS